MKEAINVAIYLSLYNLIYIIFVSFLSSIYHFLFKKFEIFFEKNLMKNPVEISSNELKTIQISEK